MQKMLIVVSVCCFWKKDKKLLKNAMKCEYGIIKLSIALKKNLIVKQSSIKKSKNLKNKYQIL